MWPEHFNQPTKKLQTMNKLMQDIISAYDAETLKTAKELVSSLEKAGVKRATDDYEVKSRSDYYTIYKFETAADLMQWYDNKNVVKSRRMFFVLNRGYNREKKHLGFQAVVVDGLKLRELTPLFLCERFVEIAIRQAIVIGNSATNFYVKKLGYSPKLALLDTLNKCVTIGYTDAARNKIFWTNIDGVKFGALLAPLYRYSDIGGRPKFEHKLTKDIAVRMPRERFSGLLKETAVGFMSCFNMSEHTDAAIEDADFEDAVEYTYDTITR